MLFLGAQEVMSAVAMPAAIRSVGEALAALSSGQASAPERLQMANPTHDATTLAMPALAEPLGVSGVKLVSVYPHNGRLGRPTIYGVMLLLDATTGEPLALMEASSLTALRTGAVVGLATDRLARAGAVSLGVIGTGTQAVQGVRAITAVRPIREVRLYNRSPQRAEAYAQDLRKRHPDLAVTVVADGAAAAEGAAVVLTATTSPTPVLPSDAIGPGAHINAIGAYRPTDRELPTEVVARADRVVVESRESALAEAGDLLMPIQEGRFRPEQIAAELGEIMVGSKPGRQRETEVTLFKSVGHAVMDVVLAKAIYETAVAKGLGQRIRL